MPCAPCAARRKKALEAARNRRLIEAAKQGALGAAEMLGLKEKTALLEEEEDHKKAKLAQLATKSSPPGAWPTE